MTTRNIEIKSKKTKILNLSQISTIITVVKSFKGIEYKILSGPAAFKHEGFVRFLTVLFKYSSDQNCVKIIRKRIYISGFV